MNITLATGKNKISVELPDERVMGVLLPGQVQPVDEAKELRRALDNPIDSPPLSQLIRPGQKIAIVTSDITRPCPSYKMLPPLLADLEKAGIPKDDIFIMFALASHRPHTREEMEYMAGKEVFASYRCLDSDPENTVLVGVTSKGTPVELHKEVVAADMRIGLGNLEYHYFVGYSGGAKALFPGVSTPRSIQANHRMMTWDTAVPGVADGNPVREDLEELTRFVSLDFIFNVVLGPGKEILHAVAGHYIKAHRRGCEFLDKLYKMPLDEPADIVLVSNGGFPKDLNMYQSQKALDNARFAVKEGGVIILLAACQEGYGSQTFERWVRESDGPEDILKKIQENFELGGHKAAAIALVWRKAKMFLVSELDDQTARDMFFEPAPSVEFALAEATKICGPDSKILVMPIGGSTLPVIKN